RLVIVGTRGQPQTRDGHASRFQPLVRVPDRRQLDLLLKWNAKHKFPTRCQQVIATEPLNGFEQWRPRTDLAGDRVRRIEEDAIVWQQLLASLRPERTTQHIGPPAKSVVHEIERTYV